MRFPTKTPCTAIIHWPQRLLGEWESAAKELAFAVEGGGDCQER